MSKQGRKKEIDVHYGEKGAKEKHKTHSSVVEEKLTKREDMMTQLENNNIYIVGVVVVAVFVAPLTAESKRKSEELKNTLL